MLKDYPNFDVKLLIYANLIDFFTVGNTVSIVLTYLNSIIIFGMIMTGVIAYRIHITDRQTLRRLSVALTTFFYPALIFATLVGAFSLSGLLKNWPLPAGGFMIMAVGYLCGVFSLRFFQFRSKEV